MENNQQLSVDLVTMRRSSLRSSIQGERKYESYGQLLEEIDRHNNRLMGQYMGRGRGGLGLGQKCLDDVRVDNQLLRQYTDAVYRQYNLNNQFNNTSQTSSQKTLNSQKKHIKLKKQNPTSSTNPPNPNPSSTISSKQPATLTQNAITPTKPPCLKKSTQKSTAYSHIRSKTGLTLPTQSKIMINQPIEQSLGCRSQNNQVLVSEFDDLGLESQVKFHPMVDKARAINNQHYARNFSQQLTKQTTNKKQTSVTYCPICQQELSKSDIRLHENKCPQLTKLYNLQKSALSQYASWKIQQHLSTIRTILTNMQIKKSIIMQNELNKAQLEDEDAQEQHKDLNENIDINLSHPQFAMKKKEYVDGIVQQCGEAVKKCIWFQEIKENLTSVNIDCENLDI